ncbi:MAG TPA: GNAT family N-acetyltransferase [Dehalococcoidia bacterium]|nr:GNAT family N-acetyltransferase [Dehalococcoidia bacterium]
MSDEVEAAYPSQYETEVLLKDGSRILLRPIKREDTEKWLAFYRRLSQQTLYLRFGRVPKEMGPEDALRFCTVDYNNTFALVAEVQKGEGKEIIAIGRYYRLPNKRAARVAFAIEDAYHGKGIGTRLIEWLANIARDHGITVFEGDVLAENERMMAVLRDYGFHIESELKNGVYHVTVPIARSRRVMKKEEERERLSTLTSIRHILAPRSVAVIGASREPGSIGQLIFQSLLQNGFSGVVYPVNPKAEAIMSVKAYPSILDVPGEVELAIIVVPTQFVAKVADECGRKGVRAIVVISDGFKERGPEGAAREEELRDITLGHGMRLVGPNCMGVINTDPQVRLNASFARVYPPAGNIAFLSQSGAMGVVILEYARDLNTGISSFVSVGNRADISSNDLLQYWEQDPRTKVILLYLESFGNPRKFSRIAKRVSAKKPIVVVKSGTTLVGSRAASSHTGALATPVVVSDALFRQAGIIRVDSIEELFDVATLLSNQPLPQGRRLAIITNGGGPGIIAADASEQRGLILPEFSPQTVAELRAVIKRDIRLNNPLDLTGSVTEEEFKGALRIMAEDGDIDAVLTLFVPAAVVDARTMEDAIRGVLPLFRRRKKPLLACFMGQRGFKAKLGTEGNFVPCYPFPEDAISALAKAVEYRELAKKPRGVIPRIRGIRRLKARRIIEAAMAHREKEPLWLSPAEIAELLGCYGIRFVETMVARTADEAAALAAKIGFPVVVKLNSSTIIHKTDVGGVMLDLRSEDEVISAFNAIRSRLADSGREHEMEGISVQRMVKSEVEVIAGVTQDPTFGPLIMFGLGGVYAELMKDIALRLHPLTEQDAQELISSVKMAKLFEGFRGSPPSDTQALQDLLLRLSAMVEDIPQIAELDFNPVKVMPQGEGYWVVDARISLR